MATVVVGWASGWWMAVRPELLAHPRRPSITRLRCHHQVTLEGSFERIPTVPGCKFSGGMLYFKVYVVAPKRSEAFFMFLLVCNHSLLGMHNMIVLALVVCSSRLPSTPGRQRACRPAPGETPAEASTIPGARALQLVGDNLEAAVRAFTEALELTVAGSLPAALKLAVSDRWKPHEA